MKGSHDPRYDGIYQRGGPASSPTTPRTSAMMTGSPDGGYVAPWFSYATVATPPLLILGIGTALGQLFLLSIRHTLRTTFLR